MAYIGQEPKIEFSSVPTKDSFTGDGSTVAFDLSAAVATGAENALEVFVDNVRQEPGSGKAYTLGLDGSNDNKRITFTAAPANGAAIYVINDKSNTTTLVTPTNLGGVELILDADSDTSITADTDDQIDIKIAAADHLQIKSSSGDTVLKPMVDAKDIIFQQFDGNKIFCIDDGNFVSVGGNSAAPGEIRIYEDTDLGANYTGFKAGNLTASVAYQLPLADGSSGQALATDGSGVLSWTTVSANTPSSADGQALGSASLEWSDLFLADGAVINLGADQDVTLTHVADTGVLLNGASVIQFRDSGLTIGSNADGDLDIVSDGTAVDSINIESAGGITLDAGTAGSGVIYEDDGTEMMRIHNSSSDVIIETKVSDKDFIIKGNDGGSVITPFTLDMSAGGDLFLTGGLIDLKNDGSAVSQIKFYCESSNAHAQTLIGAPHSESATNTLTLPSSGGDAKLVSVSSTATLTNKTLTTPVIAEIDSGSTITLDATTDIVLDADGGDIFFKDDGTTFGSATNTSGNLIIKSGTTTAATFSGANVTFAGTIGSGAITSTGIVTGTGFTAGNAVLAEAELELLDGLTAGTAIASKVVTTDANIDTTGQRNLTITGELDAATLDISGDADIDGTTNLDVVDIDGAVDMASTLQVDGAITSSTGATITTADNTDTLSLVSTDADADSGPNLRLYRNNDSNGDGDVLGQIDFEGRNDNSQDVVYARIRAVAEDITDGTEDARIIIEKVVNGSTTEVMRSVGSETVFNDGSIDLDFRVESNGNANMLFVDGGGDRIYIGRDTTDGVANVKLQVEGTDSSAGISIHRGSADTAGAALNLSSSRGASLGDDTVVQDGDDLGSISFWGADGTDRNSPAASISGQVDGSPGGNDMPGRLVFKTTTDGGVTQTERMRITSGGIVGMGATASGADLGIGLHIKESDSGAAVDAWADALVLEGSADSGMTICSGASSDGSINFADSGDNDAGRLVYNHSQQALISYNAGSEKFRVGTSTLSSGGEGTPDTSSGGLCLNQGGDDTSIFSFKSSDIAHGMTSNAETDTYYSIGKNSGSLGGAVQNVFSENNGAKQTGFILISAMGNGFGGNNQLRATDAGAAIDLRGAEKGSGTSYEGIGGTGNILSIRGHSVVRFLFDANGDFHADNSSTTFDEFDDAQLVRAYDLSHGKGVVNSKFDKFVAYNHEKLAELELVGREDDGTPNSFVNVTGMQRLHNGAIWQQYEATQKLTQAMYKLASKTLGKEEADKLLDEEELKLLN